MNNQRSVAQDGFVRVEVEADGLGGDLPAWVDTRTIADAAILEYGKQRAANVGDLPLPEHEKAWR